MKSIVLPALLGLWLTLSGFIWLIGMGFAGEFDLPSIDTFTLLVFYAPWLILILLAFSAFWQRSKKRDSD